VSNLAVMREEMIECVKALLKKELIFGTEGNISMRVPGVDQMLITPGKTRKSVLNVEDLMVVTFDGELVDGPDKPSSGIPLHGLTYKKRTDVNAAIHTHSLFSTAVAVTRGEIPPIHDYLVGMVGGTVTTALWDTYPDVAAVANNCLTELGDKKAVLISNHGLYVVGNSLEDAMEICDQVENIAKLFVIATIIGGPVELEQNIIEICREQYLSRMKRMAN
jgi:L-fuculose-phosphate aldolase